MEKLRLEPSKIGRVDVGTETIQDKAKSIKTYLMQLFPSEVTDISGADHLNACYGGIAALLDAVSWIESAEWDGRLALVVAADIAVYEKGPARPTGGAGAVAILIGPKAPLVIERRTAAHFSQHSFDFYKPHPHSEYPKVNGPESISCFFKSLDACYNLHLTKIQSKYGLSDKINLDHFDFFVFHSPYGKLVQKSLGRLLFNDFLRESASHPIFEQFRDAVPETTYLNRELDQAILSHSQGHYARMTLPTRLIPDKIGNCYTASIFMGLASLISSIKEQDIYHHSRKRIGMFAYGSGLTATMFSILINGSLENVSDPLSLITSRLEERIQYTPEHFSRVLSQRQQLYLSHGPHLFDPNPDSLWPGTYYLDHIDEYQRRYYFKSQ